MNTKTVHRCGFWQSAFFFGFLVCSTLTRAAIPPDDQASLQGTWQTVAVVDSGTIEHADRVSLVKLKIKDDHYVYDFGDHSFAADFKIDPSKTPKEMNVTFLEGPQTGKTMKAIYSIAGDTLKICAGLYTRPTDFVSSLEAQSILFTFQRDLPSKDITGAEILNYGIYKGESVNDVTTKSKGGVPIVYVTARLLEQTHTIPATLNTRFGFQCVVHGSPRGKPVKLRGIILCPPITDVITGKTTTQDGFDLQVGLEESKDVGLYCILDKRSDLVTGTWTIQLFDHDKKLLEKAFTLIKP